MDTHNLFAVGVQGSEVRVMVPPSRLTPEQAMMFAAWLVVCAHIASPSLKPIGDYIRAVEES